MSPDYELAQELKRLGSDSGRGELQGNLEGTVVSGNPLKISLYGGEIMAPPLPLKTLFCAQGFYRDKDNSHLYLEEWRAGDKVACCMLGNTLVVLGRLADPGEQMKVR